MGKKEFEFYQDVKVTVWQRQHFRIEAESIEEARKQAEKYTQFDVSYEDDIDVDEIEWLYDTEKLMIPEDNNGESTIEVYELDDKGRGVMIADNADPDKSNLQNHLPQGLTAFGGTMICFIIPRRDDGTCVYLLVSKSVGG